MTGVVLNYGVALVLPRNGEKAPPLAGWVPRLLLWGGVPFRSGVLPVAFWRFQSVLLGLAMLLAGGRSSAAEASPIDVAMTSVVRVRTVDRTGPGFLAKHGGIAVTSLSLMQNALAATVECSNGEVLSVTGFLGVDAESDLVVLRLSDLSDCPPLRIADDVGDRGQRVWALALPDNSGDSPHESQIGALLVLNDRNAGTAAKRENAGPAGGPRVLGLNDAPPHRYAGGALVDATGAVLGVVSAKTRRSEPGVAPFAIPCSELRSLLGDLTPRPRPLAELAGVVGQQPPAESDTPLTSSAVATKKYWDGMAHVLGSQVVSHHKWCVKNGFRDPVVNPADRRTAKSNKRAVEEAEARERARLRGMGFDPLAIMVLESRAKSSAESQKVNRSLEEIATLQKFTSQALAALDTQGVSPEVVRFVSQLGQAYREAGELTITSLEPQSSRGPSGESAAQESVSSLRTALERISQLQYIDGPRLQEKLKAELSTEFGPVVSLSPEERKLVSGEAAAEARRQAAVEAEAAKLWTQYERARSNGGGEKTLRHIIEKYPGSPSAERAQRLLDEMSPE